MVHVEQICELKPGPSVKGTVVEEVVELKVYVALVNIKVSNITTTVLFFNLLF